MHRQFASKFLAFLAVGLILTVPAIAGEEDLREQVRQLENKLDALSDQQSTNLEQTIEQYLDESSAWTAAQGDDGLKGVSITASLTSVAQWAANIEPGKAYSIVSGDVDLGFHFNVTENLDLHIATTANTSAADSAGFGHDIGEFTASALSGGGWNANSYQVFGGVTDGIGTNGTTPTNAVDMGGLAVYEAYVQHRASSTFVWEFGMIDPRTRFMQNAFAGDENTQFVHNDFDDTAAVLWLYMGKNVSFRPTGVLALHMWVDVGNDKNHRISWAWFNAPGEFWDNSQLFLQWAGKFDVSGREMNARVMFQYDNFFTDANGDANYVLGVSWDWMVTATIGLFFTYAQNFEDVNTVESTFTLGAELNLVQSRPNDRLGVGFGYIKANTTITGPIPEDTEFTFEIYYRYATEGGKLQITPYVIYVMDPGGLGFGYTDDLIIIGNLQRLDIPSKEAVAHAPPIRIYTVRNTVDPGRRASGRHRGSAHAGRAPREPDRGY